MTRASSTRQWDLRPDSPASVTQPRLITARIVTTATSTAGTDAARSSPARTPTPTAPSFRTPPPYGKNSRSDTGHENNRQAARLADRNALRQAAGETVSSVRELLESRRERLNATAPG